MTESVPAQLLDGVAGLSRLLAVLQSEGFEVVGPTVREGVVDYDRIESVDDLPAGWSDNQVPGSYRLEKRDDDAVFQYASTAQSWKRVLHPPVQTVLTVERTEDGLRFVPRPADTGRLALLGVRACDLQAISILERALAEDPEVAARRARAFIVAVNCGRSASTCFCTSMKTGPGVDRGFDLALTELLDGRHRFLVEVGSTRGARLLKELETSPAAESDYAAARHAVEEAAHQQAARRFDPEQAREALLTGVTSAHWEKVAEVCTACGACTMVCPTCFCTTIVESSDVAGQTATRTKLWDSCFSQEFSHMHGGSVRVSGAARYRQWITHKLAYWFEQFGTSGCVGCGRCITWCPVAIDIMEEARSVGAGSSGSGERVAGS